MLSVYVYFRVFFQTTNMEETYEGADMQFFAIGLPRTLRTLIDVGRLHVNTRVPRFTRHSFYAANYNLRDLRGSFYARF